MFEHYNSEFFSAKFDNVPSTFFVYQLGQKIFHCQTVLGLWDSSLDPQFIWMSPWLGWKAIYVWTLYSEFFSAKFDNVPSTFFVYHLGQKFFHCQTVLGPWHSSLDPQLIWLSPAKYLGNQSHRASVIMSFFSIGTKRSFDYSFPKSTPKTFTIVLKVLHDAIVTHINKLSTWPLWLKKNWWSSSEHVVISGGSRSKIVINSCNTKLIKTRPSSLDWTWIGL